MRGSERRDYSRFEKLSTEELRIILRQDSMLDEGDASDTEAILAISTILAEREQKEAPVDVDAAWAAFQKEYRPFTDPEPLYALDAEDNTKHPAGSKRPRFMKRLIGLAAVIALILTVGTVTAYARRYDLFGYVAKWSRDTFRFVNAEKTSVPFYNMSAALSVDGITEPLVPRWLPEGYGEDNVHVSDTPLYVQYFTSCYIGENTIHMTVFHYKSEKRSNVVYETDPTVTPEVYEAGGIDHYLMMNGGYWRALWCVGDLECSILGKVSLDEMKRIVDSIYTVMPNEQYKVTGISIIEKNDLYSIRIIDPKGVLLAEYGPYGKKPTIEEVGKLRAVSLQTGTGKATRWTIYYDPRTGQLSEPFMGVLNTNGELVVYIAPGGKAVCVSEIFGQYYERFEAFSEDLASTAEPFIGAELSKNDNSFSLTYLSGPDYHRKTDRFTLSRDILGNSLSVTEKESWFNDFEVQGEQVRLRCHLVLCNEGEKPQTVHLVGVFREDAGKLLRYARLNAAHPEDEDSFDFVLMPGKNVCDVVFIGEHGLENVKQNRLLPEIEIIRVG